MVWLIGVQWGTFIPNVPNSYKLGGRPLDYWFLLILFEKAGDVLDYVE